MSPKMPRQIPVAAARKDLAKVVEQSSKGERIKVTRYGKTLAVLIPKRDLAKLEDCEKANRPESGTRRRSAKKV